MNRPHPIALNHAWFAARPSRRTCLIIRTVCQALPVAAMVILFWSGFNVR